MREMTIRGNDAGQRLDKFLRKAVKRMPPSLLYKSIRLKKIKVNRKRATPDQMLCEGDTLQLFLNEDLFSETASEGELGRIRPSFGVAYEDENILIAEKKAGMLSHSEDDGEEGDTLIEHIKAYLYQKGEYDPAQEQSFAPALCNRIDRNTSGLVIAAKNAPALREMNEIIKNRDLEKTYLCAVHGTPEPKEGTLRGYLVKDAARNEVTVTKEKPLRGEAKTIVTAYRVLAEADGLSLLSVELITGRTHQIRAHFASIGHPLLGEGKYGINREDKKEGYRYQALVSYSVTFRKAEGMFAYLNGRTVTVSKDHVPFLKQFGDGIRL